jgi:hypothetical protein
MRVISWVGEDVLASQEGLFHGVSSFNPDTGIYVFVIYLFSHSPYILCYKTAVSISLMLITK